MMSARISPWAATTLANRITNRRSRTTNAQRISTQSYSTAFNILGYAYRQDGNYNDAEAAFKKYIELIPNDPNPYDSYAELLLKMGRFDEAITQYKKALAIDSQLPELPLWNRGSVDLSG
jgi:tetratricopeptide (TPR) repeat protein